jgi:hypothetical protein
MEKRNPYTIKLLSEMDRRISALEQSQSLYETLQELAKERREHQALKLLVTDFLESFDQVFAVDFGHTQFLINEPELFTNKKCLDSLFDLCEQDEKDFEDFVILGALYERYKQIALKVNHDRTKYLMDCGYYDTLKEE